MSVWSSDAIISCQWGGQLTLVSSVDTVVSWRSAVVVVMQVMQLLEQFELSDVVITLVKLAIDIAEHDDPNLVCSLSIP